jgi:hypothetical protein
MSEFRARYMQTLWRVARLNLIASVAWVAVLATAQVLCGLRAPGGHVDRRCRLHRRVVTSAISARSARFSTAGHAVAGLCALQRFCNLAAPIGCAHRGRITAGARRSRKLDSRWAAAAVPTVLTLVPRVAAPVAVTNVARFARRAPARCGDRIRNDVRSSHLGPRPRCRPARDAPNRSGKLTRNACLVSRVRIQDARNPSFCASQPGSCRRRAFSPGRIRKALVFFVCSSACSRSGSRSVVVCFPCMPSEPLVLLAGLAEWCHRIAARDWRIAGAGRGEVTAVHVRVRQHVSDRRRSAERAGRARRFRRRHRTQTMTTHWA